ncbi:SHOCT domain-containing protein [Desulfosporosinus metallidurans]|uniref:SHOCT-like domain-containing protein n=1 Tax=Desulfosporosinus metallidurans TaxID=1888891 RepID=A0A1Q8QFU9_9FIRM|nr:SHOCT domain-containing protein [Desulfosporosinus metallidurans]OLN26185.1 hypothetical protein DSOL_5100 [Desulfosporosinus metallidurans]
MSQTQMSNEIKYKIALSLLKSLLQKGIITFDEYKEVDKINQCLYTPQLVEVYM